MPTQLHEDIIDDIREILTREYSRPENPPFKVSFAGDRLLGQIMAGMPNGKTHGLAADFYIFPEGEDPVFIEVGKMMPGNKWDHIYYGGVRKPRILRVSFERSYMIMNPQKTPFEKHLMKTLRKLESYR